MLLVIIISLFVVSLVLFLVEVFLMPGMGICGVASALCVLFALGVAFAGYGLFVGLVATAVVVVLGAWSLYWVMHSRRLKRLSLHARIDSTVANEHLSQIKAGDRGVALTRLALVGNACINGIECEVRSASGYIEEGTPVVVTKINMSEVSVVSEKPSDD